MRLKRLVSFLGAVLLLSAAPVFSSEHKEKKTDQTTSRKSGAFARSKKALVARSTGKSYSRRLSARSSRKSRRERGQQAPTRDRIEEIQAALAHEGAYQGEPNGKWDAASIEAMKRFQTGHNLNPSGKIDARTLQALGLGSEVAGRAAPRPPMTPLPATVAHP